MFVQALLGLFCLLGQGMAQTAITCQTAGEIITTDDQCVYVQCVGFFPQRRACPPGTMTVRGPFFNTAAPCGSRGPCTGILPFIAPPPVTVPPPPPTVTVIVPVPVPVPATTPERTAPPVTTPSTAGPATTTAPPPTMASVMFDIFPNYHLLNGMYIEGLTQEYECIDYCRTSSSCGGVDYDRNSGTCWAHGPNTACSQPARKVGCTHFRIRPCPTDAPVTEPTTTTAAPSTTSKAEQIVYLYENSHVFGGTRANHPSRSACVQACIDQGGSCWAVDWNNGESSCWFHNMDTACKDRTTKAGCSHIKVNNNCGSGGMSTVTTPTVTTTSPVTPAPAPLPTILGAYPGQRMPGGVTIMADNPDDCLRACDMLMMCVAVSFDFNTNTCYYHTEATACVGDPMISPAFSYFRIRSCPAPTPLPTPAPVVTPTPFVPTVPPIAVPPPLGGFTTGCRPGGYPVNVTNFEECMLICFELAACEGIDYNYFGLPSERCILHQHATVCDAATADTNCYQANWIICDPATEPFVALDVIWCYQIGFASMTLGTFQRHLIAPSFYDCMQECNFNSAVCHSFDYLSTGDSGLPECYFNTLAEECNNGALVAAGLRTVVANNNAIRARSPCTAVPPLDPVNTCTTNPGTTIAPVYISDTNLKNITDSATSAAVANAELDKKKKLLGDLELHVEKRGFLQALHRQQGGSPANVSNLKTLSQLARGGPQARNQWYSFMRTTTMEELKQFIALAKSITLINNNI